MLQRGRYVATVDVPFLLGPVVTPALLREKLAEKGFTDVVVSERRPASWPLEADGDYYVSVTWPSSPKVFEVPDAVLEHRKVA